MIDFLSSNVTHTVIDINGFICTLNTIAMSLFKEEKPQWINMYLQ